MSKTIDQRVVEMQFDNKQFERNVQTSMSTIDKLKQKLNFTGATKGLENVSSAAKKVNMTGLSTAVETVQARFSALEVIGVTALANITNSAVNAGKKMISALTIDPVKTGFQEYETQINAIQTILANTQSKGSTLKDVNAALDELNKYADQTIYNFTEMTKNIGTFTAAGVDLDKSVTSIKGIANLAAVSGSTSQQASTAMYQLSQALAAGKVQLMDWNSVVNAGMGGEVFQTALKRTATQLGYNVDALIEKYGSFRESLTKGGWLTAEVLTETLTQLSGAYTEADLIAQGYSESQAKEITQLAQTAVDAATKVKTFTQLWDTLKEAAQSGWTQTWEIIIGDFEEAKELLTGISDFVGNIINESANRRNDLLEGALGGSASKWEKLTVKINECGISTEQFETRLREVAIASGMTGKEFDDIIAKNGSLAGAFEKGALPIRLIIDTIKSFAKSLDTATKPVKVATDQLEYFNKVVGQVIKGDFGNGEERIKKLTAAGYDNVTVQKLVNKIWERNGKTWSNVTLTSEELTEVIGALSSKELQNIGYTKEQADALKQLAIEAEKTGTPINELIESFNRPSGRELLIDSFRNVLGSLYKAITAVSKAWREIFPPMTSEQLYNIIDGIHTFTESLVLSDASADKITRTFKGLFAILDIVTTILGGGLKIALKAVTTILGVADIDILTFTAYVGDAIVAVRDWIDAHNIFVKGAELIAPYLKTAVNAIRQWIDSLRESENLPRDIAQGIINGFGTAVSFVKDVVGQMIEYVTSGFNELPDYMTSGFVGGLQNGIQIVGQTIIELGRMILDKIKGVLGIHSPSTEFFEIGQNIITGLVNGVKAGLSGLLEFIKSVGSMVVEVFNGIDFGTVFAVAISSGMILAFYKVGKALSALVSPLEGVGDVLESTSGVLDAFAGTLKSFSMNVKAQALKNIAISIAILVGSIAVLSMLDVGKVWSSIGAIAALMTLITAMSIALSKFGTSLGVVDTAKVSGTLLGISTALLILSASMKVLSTISWEGIGKAVVGIGSFGVFVAGLAVIAKYSNGVTNVGTVLTKLATAMLLLSIAMKLISGMEWDEMGKAAVGLVGLGAIITGLIAATKLAGNEIDKVGPTIIKISVAMTLLAVTAKIIAGMEWDEMGKAAVGLAGLSAVVAGLIAITKMAGTDIEHVGPTILKISVAMTLLAVTARIISGMTWEGMAKAAVGLTALSGIVALLISITKLATVKDMANITSTLLAMSISIGILGGISVILGMIKLEYLVKGITAVGLLGAIMSLMIVATRGAEEVKGSIIAMSIAIGVMAASVAALSFIDTSKLAGATVALSAVMGMFSLIIKSTQHVGKAMGTIVTMSIALGLLSGCLYILAGLPIESTIASATALSELMLALSASFTIISKAGKVAPSAYVTLGVMTLTIGALAAILGILDYMNVEPSIETATALTTLLLGLSAACVILAAVGKIGVSAALQGALALDGVIIIIGGLMAGIGALVTYFPQLESFLDTGIVLLEKIGYGLGSFFGNIIGGFSAGITSGLPEIGTNLSSFMTNLQPFIDGAKTLDESAINGVKMLAETILILTGANFLESLTAWLTGGSSLTKFAQELVPFGTAMKAFSNEIAGIDGDLVANTATAGKALAEMAATVPNSGGVVAFFAGENSMTEFAAQLIPFGNAMKNFSDVVSGIDSNAVVNSATAGKALAEMAATVPNSGGVVAFFTGENDMEEFAKQLVPFGKAMKEYSLAVAGLDVNAITNSTVAGKALTELADTVPNTGGLVAFFAGDNDLATFGEQLISFGKSIKAYSLEVAGMDTEAVNNSATAGKALTELANTIPNTGGLVSFFTGENNMGAFGDQLVSFGEDFKTYSEYMKGVDSKVVTSTSNAAKSLVELSNSLPENKIFKDETWLNEFGDQISSFGSSFKKYYDSISGINTSKLSGVITEANHLVDMAKGMANLDTSGMAHFGSALTQLGNTGVDGFIGAFSGATLKVTTTANGMVMNFVNGVEANQSKMTKAFTSMLEKVLKAIDSAQGTFEKSAKELMTHFIDGAKSKSKTTVTNFSTIVKNVVNEIRSKYKDFRSAGIYLVDGFALGIKQNTPKALTEARILANKVSETTRNALEIHSPSDVFTEIGEYTVEGLALGIREKSNLAEKASADLGNTIIRSIKAQLQIKDTSQVMENEVGRFIVQGIAAGITEDMSAEEAAAQKAQNIVNAFQTALEQVDLNETTSNLEYSLWDAIYGGTANSADKSEAELNNLTKQIDFQSKRVQYANAQYQATVDTLGESSKEAQEAYNSLLQEQIDLAELLTQLDDIQKSAAESNNTAFQQYLEEAQKSRDFLLQMGYTAEEIDKAAAERAGYDPNTSTSYTPIDIEKVIDDVMNGVEVAYSDAIDSTTTVLVTQSTAIGSSVADALGSGIQNEAPKVARTTSGMVGNCTENIKEERPSWMNAGVTLVEGFIQGISDNIEKAANTAAQMARKAYDSAMAVFDSKQNESLSSSIIGGLQGTLSDLSNYLTEGLNSTPTITPVLDLKNVDKGFHEISSYYSAMKAASAGASINASLEERSKIDSDGSSESGATYQFTQNNYSPKALSRVEIYRQTKNQFSAFERKVTKT